METMTLEALLTYLIGGGAAGTVTYILLKIWPWYKSLTDPDLKRWIAIAGTEIVVLAAWGLSLWLGFIETPDPTSQAWFAAVANVLLAGGISFVTSQALHSKELRRR